MRTPKDYKPDEKALPPLIDNNAKQQRIRSIKQRKEKIKKEQKKENRLKKIMRL